LRRIPEHPGESSFCQRIADVAPDARAGSASPPLYKEKASPGNLQYVLEEVKYPAGVEWQGIVGDDAQSFDDDNGH
jgi:hypothetical protein